MKFGRSYQMTVVGLSGNLITINFPLTLEFNIRKAQWAESSMADFSVYNISRTKQADIACNEYIKTKRQIILRAGYASQNQLGQLGNPNSLPVIFNGYLNVVYTERSGSNLVTRINAFDHADTASSEPAAIFPANFSIAPNTSFAEMVRQVMRCLSTNGVNVGTVRVSNPPPAVGPRGRVFTGPVWEALQKLALEVSGTRVFIDQGVCNMVGFKDSLGSNNLGTLTSATGLLGIPKYTGATILASCVFEPALAINKTMELDSTFAPAVNGPCKIISYSHGGIISGSKSGEVVSDIELQSLNTIAGVP